MERSTILNMGKSTISMAIFNSFLYVYQRVFPVDSPNIPSRFPIEIVDLPIPPDFRPLAAPGGDQPRSVEEGDVVAQQAL